MKRNKITAVILSFVMSMSMLMPSIEVLADETSVPSETQNTESTENKEPKTTEKRVPKDTEKQDPKETEKTESKENSKSNEQETTESGEKKPVETSSKETENSNVNDASKPSEQESGETVTKESTKPTETESSESVSTEPTEPTQTEPEPTQDKTPSESSESESSATSHEDEAVEESVPAQSDSKPRKNAAIANGDCGDNLTWSLSDDGVLTISGEGAMSISGNAPWYENRNAIFSVVFDGSITSIGNNAFRECENITSITLPDSVTSIGSYAFFKCSGLKSFTMSKNVTVIGEGAFVLCKGLKSINIPTGVTKIDKYAFDGCEGLTNITIPNGVTSIEENTFRGCTSLTSITIPNSITSIFESAFYGCSKLKDVYFIGTNSEWNNISISTNNDVLQNATVYYAYYSIIIAEVNNGTVKVSKNKACAGEEITITATSDTGYELDTIKVNGKSISGNKFNMPAEDVTVEVAFKKADQPQKEFTITVSETINGTASVNKTKAYIDDEITITATPAEGYELDTIKVNGNAISGNTFTMDAENATVTVTFKKIEYTVTVSETINGTVTVNKTKACIGDEIIITATPAKGYELDSIKAYGIVINDNRFTMLAGSVTVTVTFKKIEYKLTANISEGILSWNKIECADHYWIEVYDSNYNMDTESTKNNTLNLNKLIDRAIKEETIEKCDTYKVSIIAYSYEYDEELGEFSDVFIADCELSYDYDSPAEPIVIGKILGVKFSNGEMSWNDYQGAVKYGLWLVEERGESIAETSLTTNSFEVHKWIDGLIESRELFIDEKFSYALYAYDNDGALIAEWQGNHAYNSNATPKKLPAISNAKITGDFLTWEEFSSADHYIVRIVPSSGNFLWGNPQSYEFNLKKEIAELVDEGGLEESSSYKIELYAMSNSGDYLAEWIGTYYSSDKYTITMSETNNGTATASKDNAIAGEEITIDVLPDPGFVLDSIKVNDVTIKGTVFNMPDMNVTIYVTFKKAVSSGKCGNDLTWTWDGKGTLGIYGSGPMFDYEYGSEAPWYKLRAKITTIYISNNVTTIGNRAFISCSKLTTISIPFGVESIGESAFWDCISLKNVILPNSLLSIGDAAFTSCNSFTSVTIPDSVTFIGGSAFQYCINLTDVTISNNVTMLDATFEGCSKLKNVTLPNRLRYTGFATFRECKSLSDITIPASVISIDESTFESCSSMKSIVIPDNVSTIDTNAFFYCKSLKSITIPIGVNYVGESAFDSCSALTDVYYGGTKRSWEGIYFGEENDSIRYSARIHYMGAPTSGKCGDNLTWRWDKNGTITISGTGAMYDFDMYDSEDDYEVSIPWWDYSDDIKKVVILEGVSSIGDMAFSDCYNLTDVTIPNSITTIGENSFYLTGIESISIPGSVKTIKDGAFQFSGLKNVTLSDGVTIIGNEVFIGCNISSITIPKSIKSIGYGFFGIVDEDEGNSSFGDLICYPKIVYYGGTEEDWNKIIFDPDDEPYYTSIHFVDGTILRGINTISTRGKTVTIKYKKLKKKTQKISRSKAITINEPQGKVTYKLTSVSKKKYKKYFKVNASNGVVTVKKRLRKGTYTLKVKVTAAGNADYKPLSRTVTVKIKVKK